MIGNPLEFGEQRAQPNRAIRHDEVRGSLSGFRKCIGVSDGAVARYAPGEFDGPLEIGPSHKPLNTLVSVAKLLLQSHHGLSACRKPKVSWFDDTRVHGTDGDLMYAIAFHGEKAVGRRPPDRLDAVAQGHSHAPLIVIEPGAGVWRSFCRQPEQIFNGAF